MNILNWFKKPAAEQTTATDDMLFGCDLNGRDGNGYQPLAENRGLPEPKVIPFMPRVVEPRDTTYDEALYTVGVNQAGLTQLRVSGTGIGAITLSMNAASVYSMIRQLEATLPEDDE